MDIYDYLKSDHDYVSKLFKQFEKSKLAERRKQIADLIVEELIIHAHSEQETLYKVLQQFDFIKDTVAHSQKEHQEIENQINKIINSEDTGASLTKKVEKLKELVDHHVREEEHEIFKQAKKVLSEEEAYEIKEQMHYLKQHLKMKMEKNPALPVSS
jgi:hemerythrin superfamily protein